MRTTAAEPACDETFDLAEGPIWLASGRLTFVDVLEGGVLVASVTDRAVDVQRRYDVGRHVAAALPLAAPDDGWILAAACGFAHLAPDGAVRVLAEPEADRRGDIRMNDAKCDPAGRLWAGSMAYDERPDAGSLFRVDLDGTVTRVLRGRQISNGIDWSPDGRTMYYSDSGHRVVYEAPYDVDRGELGELRPLIEPPDGFGAPDGLTVDAEGMVWVAFWGGGAVRRYDKAGRLLEEVRTGAPQTTSCCLAGADGRTLFITSAGGGLFAAEVDVPGPPAQPFLGSLPEPQENS